MLKRYALSLVVVVVFAVLLLVVLLTQPKSSDTSQGTGVASAATPTISADAAKLQIIQLSPDDTVNHLTITQPLPSLPTSPTPATTVVAGTPPAFTILPTSSANISPTATPFVPLTPGVSRKLTLNYLAPQTTWLVTGGEKVPIDSNQVAAIVQQLTNLNGVAILPADANNNLAQYGLDKPSLIIAEESSKGGTKTLDVGNLSSLSQNYWVKLEGDNRIWTVAPGVIDSLKGWLESPPILPPTPTAEPTVITGTVTTGIISGTITPGVISGTATTVVIASGTPSTTSSGTVVATLTSTPAISAATVAANTTTASVTATTNATPTLVSTVTVTSTASTPTASSSGGGSPTPTPK